jgi:hypothetical protein
MKDYAELISDDESDITVDPYKNSGQLAVIIENGKEAEDAAPDRIRKNAFVKERLGLKVGRRL